MLWNLMYALARPLIRLWATASVDSWNELPRPNDPHVHTSGTHPDRLLLIGSGPSIGYGVLSHNLAFAGGLARQLARRTGRAVDMDISASPDLTGPALLLALTRTELTRFDAIVVTPGSRELLFFSSPAQWRADVEKMLDHVDDHMIVTARAFVVGLPPTNSVGGLPAVYSWLWDHHSRLLNEQTRLACEGRTGISWVPFDAPRAVERLLDRGRQTYEAWAQLVAPQIADELNAQAVADPCDAARAVDPTYRPQDEEARQRALDNLDILDTPPEFRFDRIIAIARDLFGTMGAAVTFIDHERQWIKGAVGAPLGESPRNEAFCNSVIDHTDVFVVRDALVVPEFRDRKTAEGEKPTRFYAGYPLESPDGMRVGAFCLFDVEPRDFSDSDAALLRNLALRAQSELWERAAQPVAS